ncbi:S41 family peptidase [Pedobacter sp. UYP1]|uniref:S41 family peptidase n=1 Tax=Pedobacter sp. UYP1 TaxID=1756396 RepID=UPI0033930CC4
MLKIPLIKSPYKNRKSPLLFILWLILILCSKSTDVKAQEKHTDSLRTDFTIFIKLLKNNYPSLYRYNSQLKMDAILDSTYNTIQPNTTDFEFYKLLKKTLSTIKDGHLYCSLPPTQQKYREEKARFFPLKLCFTEYHTYLANPGNTQIPAGSEILTINKQPIELIRKNVMEYIVSDGDIQTKKLKILNDFFYFYYYLSQGEQPFYTIKIKTPDGAIRQIKLTGKPEKELVGDENENKPTKDLQLAIKANNTAILTIKSFEKSQLEKTGENFPEFLKESFATLHQKGIKKLIIDLRGNTGGRDTYGPLLYSYLTQQPFRYYKSLTTITTDLPYEEFKSAVSSYNNLNKDMLLKTSPHNYQLKNTAHPNLQQIYPQPNNYKGKLWLLIDGLSFSTTAEFCAIVSSNNRGKFIGEETGGTYEGNTSGVQIESTLPHTKIQISVGTIKYDMAVKPAKKPARGIIPQYKILQDISSKADSQLNYALKLTEK